MQLTLNSANRVVSNGVVLMKYYQQNLCKRGIGTGFMLAFVFRISSIEIDAFVVISFGDGVQDDEAEYVIHGVSLLPRHLFH